MSYVQKIVQPGETVLHEGRLHWIIYLPGLFVGGASILGFVANIAFLAAGRWSLLEGLTPVWAIGIIVAAAMLLPAWIRRVTTEIAVTDRRIILKTGLISRSTIEMNMDKVESVDIDQSILGRLLDYGTVTVRGTGAGMAPVRSVEAPLEFRNKVTAR